MSGGPARQLGPTACSFVLALLFLLPLALSQPQHGDEAQYLWSASYFGSKIAHLDFTPTSTDSISDPGWAPDEYWNITQPLGSRAIYAIAMAVGGAPAPAARRHYSPDLSTADEVASPMTLADTRLAAIACAAIGFALISLRLGWAGLAIAAAMLAIPQARSDFARAWAEGPLLLGLGLAVASYGTRWFSAAAGVAASFKLTALALWPLVLLGRPANRSPVRRLLDLLIAGAVWVLVTPPAWYGGGPFYLLVMLAGRRIEYARQSIDVGGPLGFYVPSRYLWPAELALLLGAAWLTPRLLVRLKAAAGRRLSPPGAAASCLTLPES